MRILRRTARHLQRDDHGATAVEYVLIAAVLGIGITSALISTKGGLNQIFGTTAQLIGSAGTTSLQPSKPIDPVLVAASPVWSGKTVSGKTTDTLPSGASETTFNFADGSKATYQAAYTLPNGTVIPEIVTMTDASKPFTTVTAQSANGAVNPYYTTTEYYTDTAIKSEYRVELKTDGTASGTNKSYNYAGQLTGTAAVTAPLGNFAQSFTDAAYIRALI